MEFKHYSHFKDLTFIKDQWNHLLKLSASHVPFLTFEYLSVWWETRGGGEWPDDSTLVIITAFEGDQLVGVAPLFHAENILGQPALMFVGAIEVSDFLDVTVKPEDLPDFLSGLLDYLYNEKTLPHWEVLDWYNILESSPTLAALKGEADQRGWSHQQIQLQPAPYVHLPGDFQAYLSTIDKKQRHEIRRKMRNLESNLVVSDFYIVQDRDQLTSETQALIDMMAQDPIKREFLTDAMRQHMHNTVKTAFDHGWLHLAFLTLDGEKAAAHFSFCYNNRIWCYNSGWEWDFRDFSPGWVLLTHILQWANENGIDQLDFMRGDEPYKYKFGGIDRYIYRVTLKP